MTLSDSRSGAGLIPWAPLAGGHLARPPSGSAAPSTLRTEVAKGAGNEKKFRPYELEVIKRVEALAKEKDTTMARIALAWTMKTISSPIVGVSSVARLEEAIIGDFKLTDEEIKKLEEP